MCDELVMYATACMLRNKITCAMVLNYSQEELRNVNRTRSSSPNCTRHMSRRLELDLDAVDDRNILSVLLYALHAPQAFQTVESDGDFFRSIY